MAPESPVPGPVGSSPRQVRPARPTDRPDGRGGAAPDGGPRIDWHRGDRAPLRPLFRLADDSEAEIDAAMGTGRVLVAREGDDVIGHAHVVAGDGEAEITNLAVRADRQGRGIGRRLVEEVVDRLRAEGVERVRVATAAADVGLLRFYQRLGFRFRSVERDRFTAANGYPETWIDGILLRDRVWFDRAIGPTPPAA